MIPIPGADRVFSRRRLLRTGGLTVSLGAVLVACGDDDGESAPGRVGYAPPVTPLPTVEKNDGVWLRTATSIEYTVLDVYSRMTEMGDLDATAQDLVDRFVEDHTEHIEVLTGLTTEAGAEPYECTNAWYIDRTVDPIFTQITGSEAEGIAPSDDPSRDLMAVSNAFESLSGAMYQQMAELLTVPELRAEAMTIGAHEARHAAAMAITATGAPEGYISPALFGEDVVPDESGLFKAYAIPSQFGSLAAIQLVVGARNDAGVRETFIIETPSDNSLIYDGMTCEA
jgi:Ferritin-like domain